MKALAFTGLRLDVTLQRLRQAEPSSAAWPAEKARLIAKRLCYASLSDAHFNAQAPPPAAAWGSVRLLGTPEPPAARAGGTARQGTAALRVAPIRGNGADARVGSSGAPRAAANS